MTLKQDLVELLSHYDDKGFLLQNKTVTIDGKAYTMTGTPTLQFMLGALANSAEYRIEDAPKRSIGCWYNPELQLYQQSNPDKSGWMRLIEDAPREVTDAMVASCYDIAYVKALGPHSGLDNIRAALEHYEQERSK